MFLIGRPRKRPEEKRVRIDVRLPYELVQELKKHKNYTKIIEEAIVKYLKEIIDA